MSQPPLLITKLGRYSQRGVALISILLLLTLLATLAIYAAEDQDLAIRRAANLGLAEQGYQVNLSGEQWVVKVLEKDQQDDFIKTAQQQPAVDHAGEIWGNLGPPVEVGETGTLLLMLIEDLHSKLNLNNLLQGKRPARQETQPSNVSEENTPEPAAPEEANNPDRPPKVLWYQIFENLFATLEINPEMVNSLIDWVDRDSDPIGTTGAEDFYYTGLELPYRAANQNMAAAAEMVQVKEMTPAIMAKLLPFVTALPVENANDLTRINVNTASAAVLGLFAVNQPADVATLDQLIANRTQEPFESIQDFESAFAAAGTGGLVEGWQDMLSVTSEYYAGRSCAESGRVKFSMSSLLHKVNEKENVKVLQRERYFGCPAFPKPSDSEEVSTPQTNA
ncbi:MAG: type II secretion system minor pseudopilin GspK [Acidiferrobacterales bacterium]|nr:type II secretion system minor pseudopilin GspK [Acidiferrobacterales bacterium]